MGGEVYELDENTASLEITMSCNNKCISCPMPSFSSDSPYDHLKKESKKLIKYDEIHITGGEPTIHKDFFKILNFLFSNYPNKDFVLVTNGRMLSYDTFCNKLSRFNFERFLIPLYGTKKIHDEITNVKGSFEQTIRGLKNFNNIKDTMIELRVIISKINYSNLEKIANYIVSNLSFVEKVVLFPINIVGFAYQNKDKVFFKYSDARPYIESFLSIISKNNLKLELFNYPYCLLNKEYWDYIISSTTVDYKVSLTDICSNCNKLKDCPKIWKTYLKNIGYPELKPIK
ncbi:MAG: radical SAM protein [Candidatus Woesearchaeota archaeon]